MSAIKDFQLASGLKPDGTIGRLTFGAFVMAYGLTPIQAAHVLSQADHETGGFRLFTENLNYSAEGLLKTFKKYYTPELAKKHERKPSTIANHVYGGRMGNKELNDGWTFRGRGALQLTGRANYQAFADFVKDPRIMSNPDLVAGKYALASAVWYFERNGLLKLCTDLSETTGLAISRGVNLGNPNSTKTPNGLEDRLEKLSFYGKLIT